VWKVKRETVTEKGTLASFTTVGCCVQRLLAEICIPKAQLPGF